MELIQKNWSDVTISEYLDIIKIKENTDGLLSRSLELLCYLTDDDGWEDLPSSEVIKTYIENKWINNEPVNNIIKNKLNGYILKPFSKLTLSEWIELDDFIINTKLINIPALLYRKYKEDEWDNIVYEPYEYSIEERSRVFENYPVTDVIGIINGAIEYRNTLLNSFSNLFEAYEDETLTEEEQGTLSAREIKEIENGIKKDNEKKNYAWPILLDDMCAGDWSSIPALLELPHTFVFNMRMAKKVYS